MCVSRDTKIQDTHSRHTHNRYIQDICRPSTTTMETLYEYERASI